MQMVNLEVGKNVRVKKLAQVENFRYPTPKMDNYIFGQYNGAVSLPVEYEVIGTLCCTPKIDFPIIIERKIRNGIKVDGFFSSSIVKKIEENKFYTCNSIYIIEEINE